MATSLAQLSKPASPSLASPAEGRSPQELYEQGVRLIDAGNEQEATRFLDAAIRLKPDYAIAYYKRGNAYRDRKLVVTQDCWSAVADSRTDCLAVDKCMAMRIHQLFDPGKALVIRLVGSLRLASPLKRNLEMGP